MPDKAEIARINGAKSRGPKTTRGKLRSSKNATRHGLLARCVVLRGESGRAFRNACNQIMERLQPADDLELAIVEELVASLWRIRRAWAIETSAIDQAMENLNASTEQRRISMAFCSLADKGNAIHLVQRYESRLQRSYERAIRNLQNLRNAKLPNEPSEKLGLTPCSSIRCSQNPPAAKDPGTHLETQPKPTE